MVEGHERGRDRGAAVMKVVERLAAFAEDYRTRPIEPQVLHHAKRAVIDWHAALYPGSVVAPATLLERSLAEEIGRGGACLAPRERANLPAPAPLHRPAAHTGAAGRL